MTAPSSTDPPATLLLRRARGPAIVAALVIGTALILALLGSRSEGERLDPRSAHPNGTRALAQLLERRGVSVHRVDRLDEASRAATGPGERTLVVARPDLLATSQLQRLRQIRVDRLVLLGAGEATLEVLTPNVVTAGDSVPTVREPRCRVRAAADAGRVRTDGSMYRAPAVEGDDADALPGVRIRGCYGDGTRYALMRITASRAGAARTTDLVGSPSALTNSRLAGEGHAALGLGLLGAHRHLVWYVPSPADIPRPGEPGGQERRGLFLLLPDWVRFGAIQLAIAAAVLALVRARRLGPVVTEPLPVTVRASEAVEGRAHLYRRIRARMRAAEHLRRAVRGRLAGAVGVPYGSGNGPEALVVAVAAQARRRPGEVHALLFGDPPDDDDALIRLGDELDTLEQEVRQP